MRAFYRFTALGAQGMEMGGVLNGDYDVEEAMRHAIAHVKTGTGRPELLVKDGTVLYEGEAFLAVVQERINAEL
jgi:hypothetical protein